VPLLNTIEVEEGILVLTITRPERRNALSSNALAALHREIDRIAGDPAVRVVVLTGEGIGFCAGADIKSGPEDSDDLSGVPGGEFLSRASNSTVITMAAQELMASLFEKIHRLRVPVIAAVNGAAHGGGFALALACDIRIASVPFEQVVDRSVVKAREIAANPPLAVWMTKETMWQTIDAPSLRHAIDMENRTQVMCTATGELAEAFQAFRDGRAANWQPL